MFLSARLVARLVGSRRHKMKTRLRKLSLSCRQRVENVEWKAATWEVCMAGVFHSGAPGHPSSVPWTLAALAFFAVLPHCVRRSHRSSIATNAAKTPQCPCRDYSTLWRLHGCSKDFTKVCKALHGMQHTACVEHNKIYSNSTVNLVWIPLPSLSLTSYPDLNSCACLHNKTYDCRAEPRWSQCQEW